MASGQSSTAEYEVSYPGVPGFVTCKLVTERVKDAHTSSATAVRSQGYVFLQFRNAYEQKYGRKIDKFLAWGKLDIERLTGSDATDPVFDEHCCDDDNCAVCDQGNHGFCRKGCTIGRRFSR